MGIWLAAGGPWAWARRPRSGTSAWLRGLGDNLPATAGVVLTWARGTRLYGTLTRPMKLPRVDVRPWLRGRRSYLGGFWYPPSLDESVVYQRAKDWVEEYRPTASIDAVYAPSLKFAEKRYEQALKLTDGLDRKSDDIVRTAGVIAGVVAAAARISGAGVSDMTKISLYVIVALGVFVLAVLLAVRARAPADLATPMEVKDVLMVAEFQQFDPEAGPTGPTTVPMLEAATAASYHLAVIGMDVINDWKARQLGRSSVAFCIGVAILASRLVIPRLAW